MLVLETKLLRFLRWGMFCIPIFLSSPKLLGQSTPKYSNEFLSIGVGARALAMSNAMTSVADDVTAAYWNPAALTDIEYRYQFSAQHAAYFGGVANYDYVGAAMAIDTDSHVGLAIIRLGIDDIPDTRLLFDSNGRLDYSKIDFFTASDVAIVLSYARGVTFLDGERFADGLTFGVNFKLIRRKIGDFASAWGFGADLSAKYRLEKWDLGIMLRDITTTFNAWAVNREEVEDVFNLTGNDIPGNSLEVTLPKMFLGASRTWPITDKIGMLTSMDLVFTFDGRRNVLIPTNVVSLEPQLGFEFDYEKRFFFRMGMGNFQRVKEFDRLQDDGESTFWTFQPNMGMGIKLNDFTIDYALTDIGNVAESPYSHVFSLSYSLEALPGIYARNKRRNKAKKDDQ